MWGRADASERIPGGGHLKGLKIRLCGRMWSIMKKIYVFKIHLLTFCLLWIADPTSHPFICLIYKLHLINSNAFGSGTLSPYLDSSIDPLLSIYISLIHDLFRLGIIPSNGEGVLPSTQVSSNPVWNAYREWRAHRPEPKSISELKLE